ncbi:MAG: 50S ribosomal protein L25 [Patescibacteria group bacterium]
MELIAQKREIFGKKVKSLRQQGLIPAELYGHGFENFHLTVPTKEFSKTFKEAGESTIIKLKVGGEESNDKKEFNVLIHDTQRDALTDEITHIDFYQVRMDEKITAAVPLEFVGEALAVKEKGGILVKALKEVEVEALPADLPHNISVDLSSLTDIGFSIYVKDLSVGPKVKIKVEPETVVATVTEPTKEEVVEKPISVGEVKVEGEDKKAPTSAEGKSGEKEKAE